MTAISGRMFASPAEMASVGLICVQVAPASLDRQTPRLYEPARINGQNVALDPVTGETKPNVFVGSFVPGTGDRYNGMVTSLQQQGYTELKGAKPTLAPPFGERVSFSMAGKDKDGKSTAFCAALFFGKSVYHVQAAAGTEAEAKSLAKVAEAVRE